MNGPEQTDGAAEEKDLDPASKAEAKGAFKKIRIAAGTWFAAMMLAKITGWTAAVVIVLFGSLLMFSGARTLLDIGTTHGTAADYATGKSVSARNAKVTFYVTVVLLTAGILLFVLFADGARITHGR